MKLSQSKSKMILGMMIEFRNIDEYKDLPIEEQISIIAEKYNFAKEDVKDTILTERFINRYQQSVLNIDRLENYQKALDTQLELMQNARSEYVRLQSSQAVVARADAEFYRKEWLDSQQSDSKIKELIEGLKRNEE